jgi:acetylornithine/succinyldiaminopimelate/putrescine aminotransferase
LEIMERDDVPARADRGGERLTKRLLALRGVTEVRGLGLLLAAQLAPGIDAGAVSRRCLDAGLIVNAVTPTALRLAPPLLVTDDEIDRAVAVLEQVLQEVIAS